MPDAEGAAQPRWYRFRLSWGWLEHLYKSAVLRDHAAWCRMLRQDVPAGGVCIDVGAHGGQFTRVLSRLVGDAGQVVAIEPSSYARSVLRMVIWLRRLHNVVVLPVALGARPELAVITTPMKQYASLGYGLATLRRTGHGGRQVVSEPVAVCRLDDIVQAMQLRRVDLIKVDIEGFEAEFIRGAAETLARDWPALLIELNDEFLREAGATLAATWQCLAGLGYRPFGMNAAGSLEPAGPEPQDGDHLWRHDGRSGCC